jgi:hypothetical protein
VAVLAVSAGGSASGTSDRSPEAGSVQAGSEASDREEGSAMSEITQTIVVGDASGRPGNSIAQARRLDDGHVEFTVGSAHRGWR